MNGWSADVILGLLIPFAGTAAGSACVFFMRKNLKQSVQRALTGFAGGVMVAASIWSLLIPALKKLGRFAPDLVVFAGDCTDNGSEPNWRAFAADVKKYCWRSLSSFPRGPLSLG